MKIFVAALDWGLGHTTRMIALIQTLINEGHEVIIGATETQKIIYHNTFEGFPIVDLPSLRLTYSGSQSQTLKILIQIPHLIRSISSDRKIIQRITHQYQPDLIVSDNRYGLYSNTIPSIIVTHQLWLKLPKTLRFISSFVNAQIHRWLRKFDVCWIPDFDAPHSIAGDLSSYKIKRLNTKKIGLLSRFQSGEQQITPKKIDLLIILSGPEKQRTVFEQMILNQLDQISSYSYKIIRGLPACSSSNSIANSINYADTTTLIKLIQESKYIICRSGYSSIMDLLSLNRTALLVPTPGQTEQEYLARYLETKKLFICQEQDKFSLPAAIERLKKFNPERKQDFPKGLLVKAIKNLSKEKLVAL